MFLDSLQSTFGGDSELFLVEGESAGKALAGVRNARLQAVLSFQGKPLNALKASPGRLLSSPAIARLTRVLGDAPGTALPLGDLRYRRVLLLMDPDADGIHTGALVQLFFLRCMPVLVERGLLWIVHAPWGEIRRPGQPPLLSFDAMEYRAQCRALEGQPDVLRIRHRGLGTIAPSTLEACCVNPVTRRARALTMDDVREAARVFGGEVHQGRPPSGQ
jgi:DNA gyrase subunit B/topoisomerase-4 subunit B